MRVGRVMVVLVAVVSLGCAACGSSSSSPPVSSGSAPRSTVSIDQGLFDAAAKGDATDAKRWLAVGANPSATDAQHRTPLIVAAYENRLEVAKVLIAAGADVNAKDATQQSAYLISTSEGYLELLELTLANGADVKSLDSYNGTGLIRAAHRGHTEIIRRLLRTNIAVDYVNRLGWTALLESIILGDGSARYVDVVSQLVAAGANVNLADGNGTTPLQHAQSRNQQAIVTILARSGAR